VLFAVSAFLPLPSHAADIYGHITSDATWTSATTYNVIGDVYIDQNVLLKITEGTEVRFNSDTNLYVSGNLDAEGTSTNPIHFRANGASAKGYWDLISLSNGSSATFTNAIIQDAGYSHSGSYGTFYNNGGTLYIADSEIATSSNSGIYHNAGNTTVATSTLHNIAAKGVLGVSGCTGHLTLNGNTFTNTDRPAYVYVDAGIQLASSGNTASGNSSSNGISLYAYYGLGGDLTLEKGDIAYVIETTLTVPQGKTLTVKPGATVSPAFWLFDAQASPLTICRYSSSVNALQVSATERAKSRLRCSDCASEPRPAKSPRSSCAVTAALPR
jgi:hypothetical protein